MKVTVPTDITTALVNAIILSISSPLNRLSVSRLKIKQGLNT
jgi:hypothetical protein